MDGKKVPIDRVYGIANNLPTHITDLRLNLDPVRQEAAKQGLSLDQFNIQDIIQKTVVKAEQEANARGKSYLTNAGVNNLFYVNPYVLHQAPQNPYMKPINRTFLRLLFSVDERDRIGDTVSPCIGPTFPFKIKTITDIYQLPNSVDVSYKPGSEYEREFESNEQLEREMMYVRVQTDKITLIEEKTNIALVLDASMNPPTSNHINMLNKAKEAIEQSKGEQIHIAGGFLSASNDGYGKKGLMPAYHRANMLRRAIAKSSWL